MKEIIELIYEMSPYLLLGFLLAGLMHAFIPNDLYQRYLGGRSFRSVIHAALLGIPLPLCSCGVIPTAMSLYRQGASKGACVSFLIATPQTGVDSIIATAMSEVHDGAIILMHDIYNNTYEAAVIILQRLYEMGFNLMETYRRMSK